ncbi:Alpha-1,3-mannosyltransferase-like protein [Diatrype stigma]|uniref:Alpha-1,3/1,6-mannosyltransferase ALG2 n=1 Tax=Diatrype stigma TaxID=117547 RepID=A0AAN9V977_9PEZI
MAEKESAKSTNLDSSDQPRKRTIVFLHPDLGIGGAERLVVDAAVGLQNRGNKVVIFTSHCDPKHCFDEARDGTLDVRVRGNTLIPASILGRFSILCAILRQLHLLLQIYATTSEMSSLKPDVVFVDQLSAGLPLLRLLLSFLFASGDGPSPSSETARRIPTKIFFYCHYPDLLLARGRDRWWKRAYRLPFDALERWSMGFADAIAVNSNFTRSVVARTWPDLARRKELLTVYPCVDTNIDDDNDDGDEEQEKEKEKPLWNGKPFLLSINRFERKKDVALAIRAFAGLPEKRHGARLVVAGGHDPRVAENVAYHRELEGLAASLGLSSRTARAATTALFDTPDDVDVVFLLSVPHALKEALLRGARLLVYTPAGEHFGIVPLEAMLRGLPVLAADCPGGPRETVVEGQTGWLRDPARPEAWTDVMDRVLDEGRLPAAELEQMRRAGVRRVREGFGQDQMAERLDEIFARLVAAELEKPEEDDGGAYVWVAAATVAVAVLVAAGSVLLAVLWSHSSLGAGGAESEKVVWAEA